MHRLYKSLSFDTIEKGKYYCVRESPAGASYKNFYYCKCSDKWIDKWNRPMIKFTMQLFTSTAPEISTSIVEPFQNKKFYDLPQNYDDECDSYERKLNLYTAYHDNKNALEIFFSNLNKKST